MHTLPIELKNLFAFQKSPYTFFDEIKPHDSKKMKRVRLGIKDFYFCYHPDQAKYILKDNIKNYPKSDLVLKKILPLSGPKGLIQLNDKEAKGVRLAAASLMAPEKVTRLSSRVEDFVEQGFKQFDQAAENCEVIDLKPFLTELVLRTAGVFILNEDIQGKTSSLNESFVELNRMAGISLRSIIPKPFSPKRAKHLKIIHTELDRIIATKLSEDDVSLLHVLAGQGFSKEFIRDQVKAFMFAGYDTTASSLIFAVDSVARSLEVQNKIYQENDLPYKHSKYSQAAYKESLRLYPSAYFLPRQASRDDEILGKKIKAGSNVFISIRHIHRCPDIYDAPDEFRPERFLNKLNHTHGFLPFGGGPRVCIGEPLAIMEATVVLKKLCERYILTPASSEPPEIEGLITAHTKSPLYLKLKRRS
jgi:cytochrome P450